MARPTDYSEQVLTDAQLYLESYREQGDEIPTIEGLAMNLGIHRSTIYEWAKDPEKDEFSDILETILSKQGRTLINKGLSGKFDRTITKLLLAKHGYHDKVEQELTGKDGLPFQIIVKQREDTGDPQ